jgi:hypothetical protein
MRHRAVRPRRGPRSLRMNREDRSKSSH